MGGPHRSSDDWPGRLLDETGRNGLNPAVPTNAAVPVDELVALLGERGAAQVEGAPHVPEEHLSSATNR